ncbi:DUF692 family multinuclear iron-containing protein [Variovorax humicola]|uniref:DUF692 family multinuclear iron-containing protein n=1 Tax=Variovorax humicola TaxID=1769758 RepID=A0ABU8W3B9_9BURK
MEFARLMSLPALGVGLLLNPDTLASPEAEGAYQYLSIIPDRFWLDAGTGAADRHRELRPSVAALDLLAERVPIICHSIGLSIGSASLFDTGHLEQIARWQRRYRFAWHSDHLAFSRLAEHGVEVNAAVTLPLTRDDESLDLLVERIAAIQSQVQGPFLLENNVYFVIPPDEPYSEAAFLNELCSRSGCGLLLDLHNLYVNATNHGFAAEALLDELDLRQVVEIHIAGGDELAGFYTDSHAGPVANAVWPLLERTLRAAPWVRGVTFEYHESYAGLLSKGGVARELRRAREIWERYCRGAP